MMLFVTFRDWVRIPSFSRLLWRRPGKLWKGGVMSKNSQSSPLKGQFYGIGLGPGDPDLLTLKALRILKEVDAIIVPKARHNSPSVARDIVTRALGEDLPFVEMVFPMVLDPSELQPRWDEAAQVVLKRLEEGQNVAFVTLGDVSLYSTFFYLEESLLRFRSDIKAVLVPGISSIQLSAVRFTTPLAIGDESLGVYPLPERIEDLDSALKEHDKIVIMKIGTRLGEVLEFLKSRGVLSRSGYIRRAGFPDEYMVPNMENLDSDEQAYLSLIFINNGKRS
jgi:precorrin-2/cobalt-factor-2 C20-methyltransferase